MEALPHTRWVFILGCLGSLRESRDLALTGCPTRAENDDVKRGLSGLVRALGSGAW